MRRNLYGNYSYYVIEKQRRILKEFEAYKDQQKKIKAMEKSIKQLREWAIQGGNENFFKRAESIQKRLDKIKRVLEDLYFDVRNGESTALIGSNGSGKSTIIKIILGEVIPENGEVKLGSNTKVGYLPQNVTFNNEEFTVLDVFRDGITISEGKAREVLAKFLFYGERVFKKVKNLSGGEKSRLKLCKLIQNDINFLILDEPTNHLDIDSREMLEEALLGFKGTILFISHDRFFINKLATRILNIEDKKVINYYGDYEYFREKKNEMKSKGGGNWNIKKN